MKRLVLLAVVLAAAVVLLAAAPAVAQVDQESDQDVESGDAEQKFTVSGDGDSANRCAEILGAAHTGNTTNSKSALQANGDDDETEVDDGGSLTISPSLAEKCEQEINQAATSASSKTEAPKVAPKAASTPKAEAKTASTSEAKAEGKQAKAEAPKTEAPKAGTKTGEKKELPKTGGDNFKLFVLGIGALLVTGGLLARSISW